MADKKIIASGSTPADGEVVTWDAATSSWVAAPGVSGDVATSIEITRTTAVSTGANSIVIGNGAEGPQTEDIVIGPNASTASGLYKNIAIGINAKVEDRAWLSVAIGTNSSCDGYRAAPQNGGNALLAVGYRARVESVYNSASAFGADSDVLNASSGIAIGPGSLVSASNGIAIGEGSSSTGRWSIALGDDADATAEYAVAIGPEAKANRTSSIVLSALGYLYPVSPVTRNSLRVNRLHHVVELRASSTDATPVEATSDGAAAATANNAARNVVVLADGKVASFRLHMTAIQGTTNDAASYEITGAAKCISGTASIIGATTTTAYEDDAGWDCTVTTTGNRLVVTCTSDDGGAVAPTVYTTKWRGTLTLTYED